MKIVTREPNKIILRKRQWRPYIFGSIFSFISIFIFVSIFLIFLQDLPNLILFIPVVLISIFPLMGFLILTLGKTVTIIFDKDTGKINFRSIAIIDSRKESFTINSTEKIIQQVHGLGTGPHGLSHNYNLKFKDGTMIPLGIGGGGAGFTVAGIPIRGGTQSDLPTYIKEVSDFLGIPVEEDPFGGMENPFSS